MGSTTASEGPSLALVLRAQGGDRQAFTSLIRSHDESMRRLAYGLLGDRAQMDDALQEAYVKAYRGLPSFRGNSSFGTWLYRIVYRSCIDEMRKRRPADSLEDDADFVDRAAGPEARAEASYDVEQALRRLSAEMRAAVWLVDAEGLSYDEAARVLGTPPGTVASRVSRARAQLRREIEGGGA